MGLKYAIAKTDLEEQWKRIQARLLDEYGEATYSSWLKPLTFIDQQEGCIRLAAPNAFMRDWVKNHYAERVRAILQSENDNIRQLDVIVEQPREEGKTEPFLDVPDMGSNLDP